MHILHDPDEWESVSNQRACTACNGDMRKCNGMCNGSSSYGLVRRAPEEVAKIKKAKQDEHDKAILIEAAAIIARRK